MFRHGPGTARRTAGWRPSLIAMVAGAVALSGCGSSDQPNTEAVEPPVVSSSPSPTLSETDAILAAYREFFDRQTEISLVDPDLRRALLEPFTTDPELTTVLRGMKKATDSGQVGYGSGVLNPQVAQINGERATVEDCQDNSSTGQKVAETGKLTTRGFKRDHAVTTMRRGDDGRWRVSSVAFPDSPC